MPGESHEETLLQSSGLPRRKNEYLTRLHNTYIFDICIYYTGYLCTNNRHIYIYNMQSSSFQLLRIVPIDLDRSQSLKDDVRCLCQNLADLEIEVFGPSSMQSVGESNN